MTTLESIIFAVLLLICLVIFFRRLYTLLALVSLGKWENRFDHLWQRFKGMVSYGFFQKRVIERPFGFNHFFLFWGFVVLFLINMEFVMTGIFPRFSLEFIGDGVYMALNFLADVMSAAVLVAVIIAIARRTFFKPPYIEATPEAYVILSSVGLLMIAFFGMNATEIAINPGSRSYMPISSVLSALISANIYQDSLGLLSRVFWWIHAIVFLFFLDFIPFSKHLHILASLPNCFFRSLSFVSSLPKMVFRANSTFGVSKINQFSWKDLLDFLACAECGRCQSVCPANAVGKALSPKKVVLHGKKNLFENGPNMMASRPSDTLGRVEETIEAAVPIIGDGDASISPDALWACTTCGACMDVCPVFIEHIPKLLWMRRHLVMEKVEFPHELISFFENMEQRSNPWGLAPSDRAKWAQNQAVPRFSQAEGHEYLLYTGCLGAYDSRAKKITTSLVEIMRDAGISFGILGSEEMCCGDTMRRLGNEYVFDRMARENVSLLKKMGVRKIVTACPHCYNTLKNDYQEYGADFDVFHHSEILDIVAKKGTFKPNGELKDERIVIHDSCYLARYNNIIEEPRRLIQSLAGKQPIEMQNNGRDGFCCGAGGGRMWLEETPDTRVNRERTREALKEKPTIVAVSCPFCMTMFEDGLKEDDPTGTIRVMDIGELFHEGMTKKT
ncbi:MAG: (Fe-S)-binding protein [Syntrophobacterales bacterium]|jgi:Fe-S oxidoreductase|nr:(Fe-S)-binding protein [Syntrophobacterales bacterium]